MNDKEAVGEENTKRVGRSCNQSSTRKMGRKAWKSASAGLVEAGMYLPVQINGIEANMIFDYGARASLLSVQVYEKMGKERQPSLKPVQGEMVAVNGLKLKILGYWDFGITIGGYTYSKMAVVAELNMTGILGLDFMTQCESSIGLKQKLVVTDGKRIRCDMKGKIGCYRVSLVETLSIPLVHEMLTCSQINVYCPDIKGIL